VVPTIADNPHDFRGLPFAYVLCDRPILYPNAPGCVFEEKQIQPAVNVGRLPSKPHRYHRRSPAQCADLSNRGDLVAGVFRVFAASGNNPKQAKRGPAE